MFCGSELLDPAIHSLSCEVIAHLKDRIELRRDVDTPRQLVKPGGVSGVSCTGADPWCQWNESPHAQEPPALGLSMVNPCFSMVSTKSMVAPSR
jgi:hypothetical protein